ncbi:MAG: oligosaccharide flippase family protein [Candidatus Tantalella remota]|nr:oligosaccharide flippase family protein [Candidatus Tantalella remota]
MGKTDRILKDSTIYTVSTIVAQFIGVATSIATRRLLTPEMMGIWATFLVILNYALFAHLGIFTAVGVRIPYLRGKNEHGEISAIRDTAFTFAAIISVLMMAVLFIASFFFVGKVELYVIFGIRMTALIVAATIFYNFYTVMLRADKEFSLLSRALVFNSLAMLVFVATLTYFFGLRGIYCAAFLATLISWLYVRSRTGYKMRLNFRLPKAFELSKVGLPILIVGIAYTILISVDKIMIIKMIGAKELGFYSIAILAFTYTNTFPKLFGIVIFPNMQEAFGETDSREHILGYVKQPALLMAYVFPALLAAAYFAIPVLVQYLLPRYIPGIMSMRILLTGCFFISLAPLAQNFAIAINKQTVLIPITVAAAGLGMGLNYAMIKMGYGINGVALGTSIAYFIYFAVVFYYALVHCEGWGKICDFFLRVIAPLVYAVILIVGIEYFIRAGNDTMKILAQAAVFYILYAPVLWYINRKTEIISRVVMSIVDRRLLPEDEPIVDSEFVREGGEG